MGVLCFGMVRSDGDGELGVAEQRIARTQEKDSGEAKRRG